MAEHALRSLIAVVDHSPDPDMPQALAASRGRTARMRVIHNEQNVGFVATCNRGLAERGATRSYSTAIPS